MLSGLIRCIYAVSSLSFLFLSLWVVAFAPTEDFKKSLIWLILFIFSIISSWMIIKISEKALKIKNVKIKYIKNVEKKVGVIAIIYSVLPYFVFAYYGYTTTLIISVGLFVFILFTDLYYYNPTVCFMLGYCHYELTTKSDNGKYKTYILISKRIARRVNTERENIEWMKIFVNENEKSAKVVQILDDILIELDK